MRFVKEIVQVVVFLVCVYGVTGTTMHLTVVLTGSMEPSIHAGDVLLNVAHAGEFGVGEIVTYSTRERDIPIVHRIIETKTDTRSGQQLILTKGDANRVNDRGLYTQGQLWLTKSDILHRVAFRIPYLGWPIVALGVWPIRLMLFGLVLLSWLCDRYYQSHTQ